MSLFNFAKPSGTQFPYLGGGSIGSPGRGGIGGPWPCPPGPCPTPQPIKSEEREREEEKIKDFGKLKILKLTN